MALCGVGEISWVFDEELLDWHSHRLSRRAEAEPAGDVIGGGELARIDFDWEINRAAVHELLVWFRGGG